MTPEALAAIALGWASLLTGYDKPSEPVAIEYVPHEFFVERICGGAECDVIGGYLDAEAPYTLYIDEAFRGDNSLYAVSFVIHETVHFLQWHSGEFDSSDCQDSLAREKRALYVQNEFLVRNGHFPILRLVHGVCAK